MARKYEDMLDREPRARSWWDENDPSVVVNPTNPAIEQGGIAGTGGGKFAGHGCFGCKELVHLQPF